MRVPAVAAARFRPLSLSSPSQWRSLRATKRAIKPARCLGLAPQGTLAQLAEIKRASSVGRCPSGHGREGRIALPLGLTLNLSP